MKVKNDMNKAQIFLIVSYIFAVVVGSINKGGIDYFFSFNEVPASFYHIENLCIFILAVNYGFKNESKSS